MFFRRLIEKFRRICSNVVDSPGAIYRMAGQHILLIYLQLLNNQLLYAQYSYRRFQTSVCMYVWEWIKSCLLLRNHHVSILLMSFIDLLLVVVTYLSDVKVKLSLYAMAACRLKVRMLLLCGWLEAVSDDQIWNVIVWGWRWSNFISDSDSNE